MPNEPNVGVDPVFCPNRPLKKKTALSEVFYTLAKFSYVYYF